MKDLKEIQKQEQKEIDKTVTLATDCTEAILDPLMDQFGTETYAKSLEKVITNLNRLLFRKTKN